MSFDSFTIEIGPSTVYLERPHALRRILRSLLFFPEVQACLQGLGVSVEAIRADVLRESDV